MHPIRRRKKRPNYGVRTVEISRGKNGFGFTISGQQPCILSCIVAGSPAEKAGLRPGDYLVAVNDQSVSKVPHDDVVRLIGCSSGILKLQIAENYYSDSSDEDVVAPARPRPKYLHKPRNGANHRTVVTSQQQSRAAKVIRDLRTGAMYEEQPVETVSVPVAAFPSLPLPQRWEPPVPPPPRLFPQPAPEKDQVEFRALVGYLGTIEMPEELQPGTRLQVVRGSIRRLRSEKRPHTLVLLSVHSHSLTLMNSHGVTLAQYPADRVLFCGSSSDDERRFLGLVTTAPRDNDDSGESIPSSSCHVFSVDLRLHGPHSAHAVKAEAFKLHCCVDPALGKCREFPASAEPVVSAIKVLYSGRRPTEEQPIVANSPQPSSHGSSTATTSSNSDSGIGFRDDCGHQSDRILVVDIENRRLHIQHDLAKQSILELVPYDDRMSVSSGGNASQQPRYRDQQEDRLRPAPHIQHDLAKQSILELVPYDDRMSVSSGGNASQQPRYRDLEDRLRPASHSLEDLKGGQARVPQWGSLQELRSFVANCFEASPTEDHGKTPLRKWSTNPFLGKTFSSKRLSPHLTLQHRNSLDNADVIFSKHSGRETSLEPEETQGGVASWAASFEKLLEEPAGLHTFAEFLKKEFSHENIYFWVACERYRALESDSERGEAAQDIFARHLCQGAPEAVNVDAHARQTAQEGLSLASPGLFLHAQKQIFNLMKFDSYPRFLRSELYQGCAVRELQGEGLPFPGGEGLDQGLRLHPHGKQQVPATPGTHSKLKKSRSDAEDCRRKSLLPWHRKNRSKSKDRGESEYNKLQMAQQSCEDDAVSVRSDVTSSRSSLASWDHALRSSFSRQSVTSGDVGDRETSPLCRVFLPDGATTVVQTRSHELVRDMVIRLLDKRGLQYTAFEVFTGSSIKAVSLDEESAVLGRQEVRIEQRVVFRLDLPNRKTIGVKAKPSRTLAEVLRPILHKYGYRLELITLCLMSENEVLELTMPVTVADNQRLQVLTRSIEAWKSEAAQKLKCGPTLDEITNRVFEELLQGKAEGVRPNSEQGSIKSEDWGSEHSSGIFGRFRRRDSAVQDKTKEARAKGKMGTGKPLSEEATVGAKPSGISKAPLIAKWKAGVKLQGRSESEELYEGLKRAQRSRLEDQRGTEINFELPDFLKDKENAPQVGKKLRKLRRGDERGYEEAEGAATPKPPSQGSSLASCHLEHQNFGPESGVIPSPRQAEEYFSSRQPPPPLDFPVAKARGSVQSDPPPLPPKPKHIPTAKTSLWPNNLPIFKVPTDVTCTARYVKPGEGKGRVCRSRKAVYLDQPSSSFV